jgi:hypothetical protein
MPLKSRAFFLYVLFPLNVSVNSIAKTILLSKKLFPCIPAVLINYQNGDSPPSGEMKPLIHRQ